MLRSIGKVLGLLLAAGAVGTGMGLVALGSGWLNPYLRTYAEQQLSRSLGMLVEIGELQGNPLAGVRLNGVRLGEGPEPDLVLEALEVRYRLWALLRGAVVVDTLRFHAPRVRLRRGADGGGFLSGADPDWWANGPEWKIDVAHAEVLDGALLPDFEDRVDELNFVLGFRADPGGYELVLRRFRSVFFDPPLVVSNLTGLSLLRDGRLTLEGLRLITPGSHLRVDGTLSGLSRPVYDLALRADSLAFGEIARIFPGTYPEGKVSVEGWVRGNASEMTGELRLGYGPTACAVSGRVDFTGEDVAYDVQVEGRGVDLTRIGPQWKLDARFDIAARLQGRGVDPLSAEARVNGEMSRARLFGVGVDTANLAAVVTGGQVEAALRAKGDAGGLAADVAVDLRGETPIYGLHARLAHLNLSRVPGGAVTDLTGEVRLQRVETGVWWGGATFDEVNIGGFRATELALRGSFRKGRIYLDSLGARLPDGYGVIRGKGQADPGEFWKPGGAQPSYEAVMRLEGLELDRLTGDTRLGGAISFEAALVGEGFDPDSVRARADVTLEAPDFLGLDSARVSLAQEGRRVSLDRLMLANALMRFDGRGWGTLDDSLSVEIVGQVHDPSRLSDILGLGLSGAPMFFTLRLGGKREDPLFAAELLADSLNYEGVPMSGVALQAKWPVLASGGLILRVGSVGWGRQVVRDVFLDAGLEGDDVIFLLGNSPEENDRVYLWGRAGPSSEGYHLELDSLAVQVGRVALFNDGPCRVRYRPEGGLYVEQFRLSGAAGRIEAQNHPERPGAVVVRLEDVDLRPWSFLLGLEDEASGVLTGDITLSGTLEDPRVSAEIGLTDGTVGGVRFQEFSGSVAYGNSRAAVDLKLVQTPGREAVLRGRVPLNLVADGTGDLFPEEPVRLVLKSDGIDLGFLQALSADVPDVGGILAADLKVGGTPRRLQHEGWVRIQDGMVEIAPLNRRFDKIQGEVRFAADRIVLERLQAGEGKGKLSLGGGVSLDRFALQEFDITLQAEEFEAINLPEFNATLQADLRLTGGPESPRVEGVARLTRSVFRLSDFIESPIDSFWTTSPFIRSLSCNVRVSASRNVWIRDRDLNVEISGDVDLVKDREGFRVYGSLDSRRGRYEFQNTSFNIDRGELQFQGNVDINPDLYILGTHRLTLISGESAVISVIVGGTLLNPQITLESDTTPPLSEADILSYLVIGRPAEGMSAFLRGEGAGASSLEGQAAGLVLGVAASQLKRTIGRRLNLDVVEIDMGGGNTATRVRVGKYFGSRFFVSYAQDISSTRGQEVIVEYELLPQVTLEARQRAGDEQERERTSLGLFWKMEW